MIHRFPHHSQPRTHAHEAVETGAHRAGVREAQNNRRPRPRPIGREVLAASVEDGRVDEQHRALRPSHLPRLQRVERCRLLLVGQTPIGPTQLWPI